MEAKEYRCPSCGELIDAIKFNENGIRILKDGEWIDDFRFSNATLSCPLCKASLDFEELANADIV